MSVIADNLSAVKASINKISVEAGREAGSVKLIAVSKTRGVTDVAQAVQAGQTIFGENTVQDAMRKVPEFSESNLEWHFIGHLQSNKAKTIPGNFHWLHTLDSLKLAQKLSSSIAGVEAPTTLNCLIQVNVAGESSKSGVQPDRLCELIETLLEAGLSGLSWRGLMTIGVGDDPVRTRGAFSQLRELQQQCQRQYAIAEFDQLSMGMSNDYAIAIEEGTTMVRIGSAIFGQRG